MTAAPDRGAFPLPSAEDFRITAVGRWLRKTKIDELPQLFNVLIGEMSLVGPRPELPAYTSLYAADYPAMFQLRPGLTSPASIAFSHEEDLLASQQDRSGYYLETILPAKLALDSVYCCKLHLAGDVRLVWRTLAQIFSRHPIPARAGLALPERHEEVV